jgi:2-polyprenyl-3-methyl-5-hydroxy-6-metoxy-1,4-benzoquinol methylase
MVMKFNCRICNEQADGRMYRVREMFCGTREEFEYVQCPYCRCLQIVTIPSEMGHFYPSEYYAYRSVDEGQFRKGFRAGLRRQRNRYLLFHRGIAGWLLSRFYPAEFPFRLIAGLKGLAQMAIIDVGCGSGKFLYQLKNAGIEGVLGIDPFIEQDILYGNGLAIAKRSLKEQQHYSATFDLVMFNHSFEHTPDPGATLRSAAAILTDPGTIMIRIPTVDSYAWEHYREHWVQLDAPRHLHLHSRASLEILAKQAGLVITDVVYDSDAFQFWGSEQYVRDIPLESQQSCKHGTGVSIFSAGQIAEFQQRSVDLNRNNRGDMAAYYLRKAGG